VGDAARKTPLLEILAVESATLVEEGAGGAGRRAERVLWKIEHPLVATFEWAFRFHLKDPIEAGKLLHDQSDHAVVAMVDGHQTGKLARILGKHHSNDLVGTKDIEVGLGLSATDDGLPFGQTGGFVGQEAPKERDERIGFASGNEIFDIQFQNLGLVAILLEALGVFSNEV